MKRWVVAGVLMVGSAQAQYIPSDAVEQSLQAGEVCKRNSEGAVVCQYIGTSASDPPPPPKAASGVRTWGALEVTFPTNMPPDQHYCLKKKEHVLAKFALGAFSGNPNMLVETYYWTGQNEDSAVPVLEQLQQVAVNGHWERSYVEEWDGPRKALDRFPIYVRWVTDDPNLPLLHFTLRKDPEFGCWFLQGTSPPSSTVRMEGMSSQGRVVNDWETAPAPDTSEWETVPRGGTDDGFIIIRD